MAKYINNKVKSGRLAGSVFAVRFGEVIERAYNPYVNDPKSAAQTEARAKFKLLSQLAAAVGGVVAMAREGAVSARNIFTKMNYPAVTYANGTASIALESVKLTRSEVYLPQPTGTQSGAVVTASIPVGIEANVDRIVYVALVRGDDGRVRVHSSQVVSKENSSVFQVTIDGLPSGSAAISSVVILAYGVRDNSETARVAFENMVWPSASKIAELVANRVLTEKDVTLTETRPVGITIQ